MPNNQNTKLEDVFNSIGVVSPIITKPAQYCGAIVLPSAVEI